MHTHNITIRTMQPGDVSAVFELELEYLQQFPGAITVPGEIYLSPATHGGEDVFLAWQGERLLAYAPLYLQIVSGPANLPHRAWVEIKARPGVEDVQPVKDALLECLVGRARLLAAEQPGRSLLMSFQYAPNEQPAIDYVESRGFERAESLFRMGRDLSEPLPDVPAPAGIEIRRWKMESEPEQQMYVDARNACFPEAPISLPEWQYFMTSPEWAAGTTIAAFDGDTLVGNVTVYWSPSENDGSGYTEYIFTRPAWRGRGIARAMIAEGLRCLREHGRTLAKLEVLALNESALDVYKGLGYRAAGGNQFYSKPIPA